MTNDQLLQIALAFLPSLVVFLTAFFSIRLFLQDFRAEQRTDRVAQLKKEDHKHTLPLRLQAYERLALFCERISPGYLVLRVHKASMTSRMLHEELTATIREEFEHNVTQQIYVSDRAWQRVKQAKEETIRIMNMAYQQTGDQPHSSELSQHVFEMVGRLSQLPTEQAMLVIKEEVRKLF